MIEFRKNKDYNEVELYLDNRYIGLIYMNIKRVSLIEDITFIHWYQINKYINPTGI